jgi:O-antigen/teichoic acid export membrane protein
MGIFTDISGLKNIGIIGFGNLVGSAISALFWIYLAALLGAENYGELGYYISIAGIASSVSFIGGPMAITVLTAKKVKIESTIFLMSISASLISAIILYITFTNIGLSVYVLGAVVYNLATAELLGRKFYKKYSIYFISQKILFVVFALIFYYIIGPEGVLLGIGLSFLPFVERIYRGFKTTGLDFPLLKTKLKFISNNFFLDLSWIFERQIDKLLIGPLFGFTILGNYYLAIQILTMLAVIPEIVTKYTLPEDSSGTNTKKIKLLTVLFSVVLALIGILVVPQILPVLFPEYAGTLEIVPIISLCIIPTTISTLYISQFLGNEKSGYLVLTSIVSIIVLVIGILSLGQMFGVFGLVYSLLISDIVRAVMLFLLAHFEKNHV